MKLCCDCKHAEISQEMEFGRCESPKIERCVSPVTGKPAPLHNGELVLAVRLAPKSSRSVAPSTSGASGQDENG